MKDKKGSKSKSSKMNTSKGVRKNNNSTGSAVHFENKWKRQKDEISTASSLIRNETKWDFLNLNIWHYSSWAFMRSIVKLQSRTLKIYRSWKKILSILLNRLLSSWGIEDTKNVWFEVPLGLIYKLTKIKKFREKKKNNF